MRPLCVIGSLNMDMVISVPRFHAPGESIIGSHFAVFTGGKGGNQAVALGRLGVETIMAGMIGKDANGRAYQKALMAEKVDVSRLLQSDEATGVAFIEVNQKTGDNRIALAPGANMAFSPQAFLTIWESIRHCGFFLMQFEIPDETVLAAAERIHESGSILILDPAPARPFSDELLRLAHYLTPNETELNLLTGMPTVSEEEIMKAAQTLIGRGAHHIIVKLGARGAMLVTEDMSRYVPGFMVSAVDTTAAGDAFNAGLAFALAHGEELIQAVRYANAVGALTTTAMGAQAAMPTQAGVRALLQRQHA
ncbi:MAG: ribokinase [Clostridia bacterium]|nr:ribokinase [Clostridia bacterium]